MFSGFTEKTSEFLIGLKFNNERPWFLEHKAEYEEYLLKPFKQLAADTSIIMNDRHPEMELDLHVAKIYRDARRLHGGGPYKDHLWFSLKNWDGLLGGPMFWFEIGAVDYGYGMGFYSATPSQMEDFRKSLDANPKAFERIVDNLAKESEIQFYLPQYKRMKKDVGEILNPWYNSKRVGTECGFEFGGDLYSSDLPIKLADTYEKLIPLYNYLISHCLPEKK